MNVERIKKQANEILRNRAAECSYIEYKESEQQLDKILKTICAYGNNYCNNDIQYIFIGIKEENTENDKAIPVLPIKGMPEGHLEKCKNTLNSLRPFLYPNVRFDLLSNKYEGINYVLLVVQSQAGGPFMVSEKAEKDKRIHLKPGRYVRPETDSRIARVDEEYDLLRKFANYHYSSIATTDATVEDLNQDLLREYLLKVSDRKTSNDLTKQEMAKLLGLIDKNDPFESRVKNYGVLMFCDHPDEFIPYAYTEIIIDMFSSKRKMESKTLKGSVWKQYLYALNYINDNYLNELVIRDEGVAENRKVANFPFVAVEELLANAIVHNNYENGKAIQVYISNTQINIVNYNKPLPPLRINDLNERTFFNERDTENPELRDMFKALGIIESFGTGIGEAKRSMAENNSPELFFKLFEGGESITSVVIPVNEEYFNAKIGSNPKKSLWIEAESKEIKDKILNSGYSKTIKQNLLRIYEEVRNEVFGNSRIVQTINCSEVTATSYIKRMIELGIIADISGQGKGKYRFIQ